MLSHCSWISLKVFLSRIATWQSVRQVMVAARLDNEMSASSPKISSSFKILTLLNSYSSPSSFFIIFSLAFFFCSIYPSMEMRLVEAGFFGATVLIYFGLSEQQSS